MIKTLILIITCIIAAFVAVWLTSHTSALALYACEFLLMLIVVLITLKTPNQ